MLIEILVTCVDQEYGKYLAIVVGGGPKKTARAFSRDEAVVAVAVAAGAIAVTDFDADPAPAPSAAAPVASAAAPQPEAAEPTSSGMTWQQAEVAMRDGKKVSRKGMEDHYLTFDPMLKPAWALHMPLPGGKEQVTRWPQKAPKTCPSTAAFLAATDWVIVP